MKKYSCIYFLLILLFACSSTDKKEEEISKIPVETKIVLFHDVLFSAKETNLPDLKNNYPYMFPAQMPDELVLERIKDKNQLFLYSEIKKIYPNFDKERKELENLFKHIKYYFSDFKTPTIVTDITGVSYEDKVLYADTLLLISLDMFLGKDHEVYRGFSKYLSESFTPKHMTTSIAQKIIETKYPVDKNRTFLGQMIFEGKKAYLLDLFLPNVTDEIKLSYSSKKLAWAKVNESTVWGYFIKNEMLYSNDHKLKERFINIAPFSKFYTSIDRDSPGAIGKYMGLQIVRAYMKEYDISPQKLIELDAQTILKDSRYKPKK